MDCPELIKLKKLSRGFGGDLVQVTEDEFDTLFRTDNCVTSGRFDAPFTSHDLGVDFGRKLVMYSSRCGVVPWPEVIHEMGHIFATSENPLDCDEWEFLGWEWAVCLYIKGDQKVWKDYLADYGVAGVPFVGEGSDFGALSVGTQNRILTDRLARAKAVGLVGPRGRPLSVDLRTCRT